MRLQQRGPGPLGRSPEFWVYINQLNRIDIASLRGKHSPKIDDLEGETVDHVEPKVSSYKN